MLSSISRQWLLRSRPTGLVGVDDFEYFEAPIPEPGDGDILVRSLYFGYDASQRIWITSDGGYMPPVGIGEPMRTMGIGQVVKSRHPGYREGDLVMGNFTTGSSVRTYQGAIGPVTTAGAALASSGAYIIS